MAGAGGAAQERILNVVPLFTSLNTANIAVFAPFLDNVSKHNRFSLRPAFLTRHSTGNKRSENDPDIISACSEVGL